MNRLKWGLALVEPDMILHTYSCYALSPIDERMKETGILVSCATHHQHIFSNLRTKVNYCMILKLENRGNTT